MHSAFVARVKNTADFVSLIDRTACPGDVAMRLIARLDSPTPNAAKMTSHTQMLSGQQIDIRRGLQGRRFCIIDFRAVPGVNGNIGTCFAAEPRRVIRPPPLSIGVA